MVYGKGLGEAHELELVHHDFGSKLGATPSINDD